MIIKKTVSSLLIISLLLPLKFIYAEEYKLQADDVIRISVAGYPDMEKTLVISASGTIVLPPVNEDIKIEGLTVEQAGKEISAKLKRNFADISDVRVTVTEYQGNKIFILGRVARPGKYTFPVIPNVLEAITNAGGILGSVPLKEVRILRGGEKPQSFVINMQKYFETGDTKILPQLKPGDTIYVPLPGEEGPSLDITKSRNSINIAGEVKAPGSYVINDSLPLLDALLLAGGHTEQADLSKIRIIGGSIKSEFVKEVNLSNFLNDGDLTGNPPVSMGSTIFVPKYLYEGILLERVKPKTNVVYVLGEVQKPGTYQMNSDANIWHTIQLAGGITVEAAINRIKVVKGYGNTDYPKTLVVDLNDYMKKSDFTGLPPLESGDTVILPRKSHFWRETVKLFSEIAIILWVGTLLSE